MRVLIACEFSGIVRSAFAALGHDAWSCDLLPTEIPGNHIQGDVLSVLGEGWDMMIAHPECTHLCRSGSRWWPQKQIEQQAAIRFVDTLWNAPIARIAIENPRGYLSYKTDSGYVWRMYDELIQPWQFGDPEKKETCLWLKGLPPLISTMVCVHRGSAIHSEGPSANRKKNRSRTFKGIAAAMAQQWSNIK